MKKDSSPKYIGPYLKKRYDSSVNFSDEILNVLRKAARENTHLIPIIAYLAVENLKNEVTQDEIVLSNLQAGEKGIAKELATVFERSPTRTHVIARELLALGGIVTEEKVKDLAESEDSWAEFLNNPNLDEIITIAGGHIFLNQSVTHLLEIDSQSSSPIFIESSGFITDTRRLFE